MPVSGSSPGREPVYDALLVEALGRGQAVRLRATSWSMHPTIRPGDLLISTSRTPAVGDIALVRQGDVFLTHRVVACDGNAYRLRGDASASAPHSALGADVLGTVIAVRRDARSWLAWLGRRWPLRLLARFY